MTRAPTASRSLLSALVVAALGVALTGCTDPSAQTGASGAPSTEPGAVEPTEVEPDPVDELAGAPTGVGEQCASGTWVLVNESWAEELEEILQREIPGATVDVTGTLTLTWGAGTYEIVADRNSYVLQGTAEGTDFTQTILHRGTESGSWTTSGPDGLTLTGRSSGGLDTTVTLKAGGFTQELGSDEVPASPWSGTMTIDCAAGQLSTTVTDTHGTVTVLWTAA